MRNDRVTQNILSHDIGEPMLTDIATGRKEITTFFYIFLILTIFSLLLDSGVVPPGSGAFAYFAAAQNGLSSALCVCLLINGFVGFQLYEDGTTLSVWLLRLCSIGMFIISGAVSLMTFKGWAGLGPENTVGLFVVLYLFNAIFLFIYIVLQLMLVVNTLQDRWPLGHIIFGIFFFVIGQVILYVFSDTICDKAAHYLDGLFFATICNLLGVMMVYKVCLNHLNTSTSLSRLYSDMRAVLGFHHERRSRVQCWRQGSYLGGQGATTRGRPQNRLLRLGLRQRLSTRKPLLARRVLSFTASHVK